MEPKLSVVVLTLDEEDHIGGCLRSLARQRTLDFEVVVVDAASEDRTVEIVHRFQDGFPVPLRLQAHDRRLPVGEARNVGVEVAQAPNVAFISADAEAHPCWVQEAVAALEDADVVYGRQVHSPLERTVAAAVRGLRYHFPRGETPEPETYASNVNAAVRREVLLDHPFGTGPEEGAVDDLLLTERAVADGYGVAYDPDMIVTHRDVTGLREELAKNLREARGWGAHPDELGYNWPYLAWGGLLVSALAAVVVFPGLPTLALFAAVLWAPAAQRVVSRREEMPLRDLAVGFLASPPFDVAFLATYVRRLLPGLPTSGENDSREGTP